MAEHGALVRSPAGEWERPHPAASNTWNDSVLPVLEHFVDRTPGSFVEEKEYGLVWHHRMADPEVGEWLANELASVLDRMLAGTDQRVVRAHKAVEVRPAWASKGTVLTRLERELPEADFRLAVGDDRTDEDLFELLPPDAWTIRVGGGPSRARFRLKGAPEVRSFLEQLAAAGEQERPAEASNHRAAGSEMMTPARNQ